MFENLDLAPPDAIFGLNEVILRDPRPGKVNLGAGVYKDEAGLTPVLATVKAAEERLLRSEPTKSYLPIEGASEYTGRVQELLFGAGSALLASGRAVTVHAPGGTGALRVAADFLRHLGRDPVVWTSDPTWANHPQILDAVGLRRRSYPYFDRGRNALAEEAMLAALAEVAPGDVVLLHGCCHNPTGVDPAPAQWRRLAELLAARRALPLVDFAYQGFAAGIEEDVEWLRTLSEQVEELFVCSSYSKNFGLYNERVGALTAVTSSPKAAAATLSRLKGCIRALYSNPPAHGGAIVATILGDPELRRQWRGEVRAMRERIQRVRRLFAAGLDARGVALHPAGNGFIVEQNGMFSFSGLTPDQVARLAADHAIYIVASGRFNVAGMTEANMERLCDAVAAVVRG